MRESDQIPVVRPGPTTVAGDEAAAMNALAGLDEPRDARRSMSIDEPARLVSNAAEQAVQAADKLEQAARRVEAAAVVTARSSQGRPLARPVVDLPPMEELPPVRLRSRALGIVSLLVVIGGAVGFYVVYQNQQEATAAQRAQHEQAVRDADEKTRALREAQADLGRISVSTTPSEASVWLKLGRTNLDTMVLTARQMLRLRLELPGYQSVDTEVLPAAWDGAGLAKKAKLAVTLKPLAVDKKTHRPAPVALPALPPNLPEPTGFTDGEGPVHIDSSPPGAEVWLLIGFANTGVNFPTIAGRAYELRALADGYKPGYASITPDEWRVARDDTRTPIDVAKKKDTIDKHIDLEVDPDAKPAEKAGAKPRK